MIGPFAFEVMTCIIDKPYDEENYVVAIHRRMFERFGELKNSKINAVYSMIGRLEDRGLLTSVWSGYEPVSGGRRRRIFALTDDGRAAIREYENNTKKRARG